MFVIITLDSIVNDPSRKLVHRHSFQNLLTRLLILRLIVLDVIVLSSVIAGSVLACLRDVLPEVFWQSSCALVYRSWPSIRKDLSKLLRWSFATVLDIHSLPYWSSIKRSRRPRPVELQPWLGHQTLQSPVCVGQVAVHKYPEMCVALFPC